MFHGLPDFDALWRYQDPEATEARFRELQATVDLSQNIEWSLALRTQIARTFSLRAKFEQAHAELDAVAAEMEPEAMPMVHMRYLLERGRSFNSGGQKKNARELFHKAWQLGLRYRGDEGAADPQALDGFTVDAAHMMAIVEPPESALKWNEEALTLASSSENDSARRWVGSLHNNLGWTYHDLGDNLTALDHLQKALEFHQAREKIGPTRVARWSVARVLRALQRNEEALEVQLGLEVEYAADGGHDGFVFEELGELYLLKRDVKNAQHYFKLAFPLLDAIRWVEDERKTRIRELAEGAHPDLLSRQ